MESVLRILAVDDDPDALAAIAMAMRSETVHVDEALDIPAAEVFLAAHDYDLVLLDIQMPQRSGTELLAAMRQRHDQTPVILVTGVDTVEEKVRTLELGADDYLVKPFYPRELRARVDAVLRRMRARIELVLGPLELDPLRRQVSIGTATADLTPREFDLMHTLLQARGNTVTRADLLQKVWSLDFDPETSVVEVLVSRLRRKLEKAGIRALVSVPGKGYALEVHDEAP